MNVRVCSSRSSPAAIRGSVAEKSWSSGGATWSTSQPSTHWNAGSAASSRWARVVPLRIIPTTTTGSSTASSAISGWRRNHSCARSRIRSECTTPLPRIIAPTSLSRAPAYASTSTPSGSSNAPGPEVVEPLLGPGLGHERVDGPRCVTAGTLGSDAWTAPA